MIDPDALSPEKRCQILQGAAVVFDRDGFEGASMSRIAREANVSKGTLYNHFQSKADLFGAHVAKACRQLADVVFRNIDADAPLDAVLTDIGQRMVAMLLSPSARTIYRMVLSEAETFPELAAGYYEAGPRNAVDTLSAFLAGRAARGHLSVEDPAFAAEQFFSLCQAHLAMRYRLHLIGEPSKDEIDRVVMGAVAMFLARYKAP
jgi:AcrR family transcriptional regulator